MLTMTLNAMLKKEGWTFVFQPIILLARNLARTRPASSPGAPRRAARKMSVFLIRQVILPTGKNFVLLNVAFLQDA